MAKNSKNRALNSASSRLSGQYAGDRIYEQTRFKLAFLLREGKLQNFDMESVDVSTLDRLFDAEGHKLP